MKSEVSHIVGRRIAGVIVKAGSGSPKSQVFLLFDDGMYYEFYSNDKICGAGGVDPGGYQAALAYLRSPERDPIFATLADPEGKKVADREIALGWIRAELRRKEIGLDDLQWTLGRVVKAGFDWRVLYQEALSVRQDSWPAAPAPELLTPDESP